VQIREIKIILEDEVGKYGSGGVACHAQFGDLIQRESLEALLTLACLFFPVLTVVPRTFRYFIPPSSPAKGRLEKERCEAVVVEGVEVGSVPQGDTNLGVPQGDTNLGLGPEGAERRE